MAIAITHRNRSSNGTVSAQTHTSGSFTPSANSRLFVAAQVMTDADATEPAISWATPTDTAGLTWTLLDNSAEITYAALTSYDCGLAVWWADVGGSPVSMTVTVDAHSGGSRTFFYTVECFDVTGYDTGSPFPQASVDTGGNVNPESNSESGTITLGSSPTSGNLVVGIFGIGCSADGAPSTPTGYTSLSAVASQYTAIGVFYRTDTTSAGITSSDLGQSVGAWCGVGFEMAASGGGGGGSAYAIFYVKA